MGMYMNNYLGPFVLTESELIDTFHEVLKCLKCDVRISTKFCSICGEPAQKIKLPITTFKTDSGDITEDIKENMASFYLHNHVEISSKVLSNNKDIWWPNTSRPELRDFHVDTEANIISFEPSEIEKEIEWLRENYSDEITLMKAHYVNVEIKWGLITYYT